jgi:tetratricopeptide (TPR) repeat protein
MEILEIREGHPSGAVLRLGGYEFAANIEDDSDEKFEEELNWYFEEYYQFPFTDRIRARDAGQRMIERGELLFNRLFKDVAAQEAYHELKRRCYPDSMSIEVMGSPLFQSICWESLKDPRLPVPFSITCPVVRRGQAIAPVIISAVGESPTLNLLVVTARPGGAYDVGYRTITRPLVNAIRNHRLPVNLEFVRPGTWKALSQHLEHATRKHGSGYFHALHFDLHGQLLDYNELAKFLESPSREKRLVFRGRWGRPNIERYDGFKAFLNFEPEIGGTSGLAEAKEIAELLLKHKIPIAILNACQSGKQAGAQESSLAARLIEAGMQSAVAMAWSVTVTAAEMLIPIVYNELFGGRSLAQSVLAGRQALHADPVRYGAFNEPIELQDWVLPVVYRNREPALNFRDFKDDEAAIWYQRLADRSPEPDTQFGFRGRDLDVLKIENAVLSIGNVLLIKGMGGSGKTTLLSHLANWWEITGLVVKSFYFSWVDTAWTVDLIIRDLASKLMDDNRLTSFSKMPSAAQRQLIASVFRDDQQRYLLVLDNLESVTSQPLAIPNALDERQRRELHEFLTTVAGGSSIVLLGSRTDEAWLSRKTFSGNIHLLGGLDNEAASDLADDVLIKFGARQQREEPAFSELMVLLGGYPLAIEIILPILANKPVTTVLKELRHGLQQAGEATTGSLAVEKTTNLLACIEYSHVNLEERAQRHLLCFAPFSAVVNLKLIGRYSEALLTANPFDGFEPRLLRDVAERATLVGLLERDQTDGDLLRPHPLLTWFLTRRLVSESDASVQSAIEYAFESLFNAYSGVVLALYESQDPEKRREANGIVKDEYSNFCTALRFAIKQYQSIRTIFMILMTYLEEPGDQDRALALGKEVLELLSVPLSSHPVSLDLKVERFGVIDAIAARQLKLAQPSLARETFENALQYLHTIDDLPASERSLLSSSVKYMLGVIAIIGRDFDAAERHLQTSLRVYQDFSMELQSADCFHQLAVVEWERLEFGKATDYCQVAIDQYKRVDSTDRLAAPYVLLGHILFEKDAFHDAIRQYKTALEIYQNYNIDEGTSACYYAIGRAQIENNSISEGRLCLQRAFEIKLRSKYPSESMALNHMMLGLLAEKEQRYEEAEGHYLKSLELLSKTSDYYNFNMALRSALKLASTIPARREHLRAQLELVLGPRLGGWRLENLL